jgi:hypothetical protein
VVGQTYSTNVTGQMKVSSMALAEGARTSVTLARQASQEFASVLQVDIYQLVKQLSEDGRDKPI